MADDYMKDGKRITDQLLISVIDCDSEWKEVKKTDGITISSRKSPHIEKMYKAETILDASPESVLAMVSPLAPYRLQWDPFLEDLKILRVVSEKDHMYVIQHFTRAAYKGAVSARDAIDVVTIGKKNSFYYISAGGSLEDVSMYPAPPERIRTFQHPAGYVIHEIPGEPNKCKFVMVFHIDLNMNHIASIVTSMVKPTLMVDKVKALRKAIDNTQIDAQHLMLGL